MPIAWPLTQHQLADVAYYGAFLLGQWFFILKRMSLAVRSPMNALKNRRAYLYQNWDILLIRTGAEFVFPYYVCRHAGIAFIAGKMGWTLPTWLQIDHSAVAFACLGYVADSVLDGILGREKIFGITIPEWLCETIPQLPVVQNLVAKIKQENGKT